MLTGLQGLLSYYKIILLCISIVVTVYMISFISVINFSNLSPLGFSKFSPNIIILTKQNTGPQPSQTPVTDFNHTGNFTVNTQPAHLDVKRTKAAIFNFSTDFNWTLLDYTHVSLASLQSQYKDILTKGQWLSDRLPDNSDIIGILVPYRSREDNLIGLLANMIPYLQHSGQSFQIFVINQAGQTPFNRATLLNIGILEGRKVNPSIRCFVFHDVDKVPMQFINYSCSNHHPRHMYKSAYKISPVTKEITVHHKGFYNGFVGGVLSLPNHVLDTINGCTNLMYGWGGEDDNLWQRLENLHIPVENVKIGQYYSLEHGKDSSNKQSSRSLSLSRASAKLYAYDGLNATKYTLDSVRDHGVYMNITVTIPGPQGDQNMNEYFMNAIQTTVNNITNKRDQLNLSMLFARYIKNFHQFGSVNFVMKNRLKRNA